LRLKIRQNYIVLNRLSELFIAAGALVLLMAQSCSTTNHAPVHKQAYHDITSRYNAYHNANEKMKASLKNIEANVKDNYKEVLRVFPYSDTKQTSGFGGDFDAVIKHSTTAIQLHPYSNWSDDHFLLVGKSYYLKGELDKATQSFRYISTKYKEGVDYIIVQRDLGKKSSDVKRKKKPKKDPNKPVYKTIVNKDGTKVLQAQDNRPEKKLIIHDHRRSDALVWLVKSLTQQKQYQDAEAVVAFARSDNKFYKDLDRELLLAEADIYVANKNYQSAIPPLEKVLEMMKKKKRAKTRPTFVLAQCYEAVGNYSAAAKAYKNMLKGNPSFDMEFYSKIKRANLGRKAGGSSAEIKKLLTKMSRDGKNKEYLDQIFYELGEISLAESDKISARKYFRKSIDANTTNDEQRAQTFLRLAEIDFSDELYTASKFNYDSCVLAMKKEDERFNATEAKAKMLDRLVEQLNIIQVEDSLQKIAKMSPDERLKFAKKIIADREAAAQKLEDEKTNASKSAFDKTNTANQPNQPSAAAGSGSSWYFYNVALRSQGYNDFVKKWGRRKYEENWRRKDKSSIIVADESIDDTAKKDSFATAKKSDITTDSPSQSEEETVLVGIPKTEEELNKSTEKLVNAYYALAIIYKEDLQNYRKSSRTFEEMNERYGKHKLLLESYYYIYLLAANHLNNSAKAEDYKNKILNEFPNSKIAMLLRNANYLAEETARQNELNSYYAATYNDFAAGALASASEKISLADVQFKPNPLRSKFDLLKVLIIGNENRLDDYVQALNKLIATTTDPDVKKTAEDLLASLNSSGLPMIDLSKQAPQAPDTTTPASAITAPQITQPQQKPQTANQATTTISAKTTLADTIKNAANNTPVATKKDTVATAAAPQPKPFKPLIDTVISNFNYTPDAPHLLMVFFKDPTVQQAQIAAAVANINQFNGQNFAALKLSAKPVLIDDKNKLITVRQFKNANLASEYSTAFVAKPDIVKGIDPSKFYVALISFENFSKLLTERKTDVYEQFYLWKYE